MNIMDGAVEQTREGIKANVKLARQALEHGDRDAFEESYDRADYGVSVLGMFLDKRDKERGAT